MSHAPSYCLSIFFYLPCLHTPVPTCFAACNGLHISMSVSRYDISTRVETKGGRLLRGLVLPCPCVIMHTLCYTGRLLLLSGSHYGYWLGYISWGSFALNYRMDHAPSSCLPMLFCLPSLHTPLPALVMAGEELRIYMTAVPRDGSVGVETERGLLLQRIIRLLPCCTLLVPNLHRHC